MVRGQFTPIPIESSCAAINIQIANYNIILNSNTRRLHKHKPLETEGIDKELHDKNKTNSREAQT